MKNIEVALDIAWLHGLVAEMERSLADRRIKVLRHERRHMLLLDGGSDLAIITDLTPGRGHVRPAGRWLDREWAPWGGHRTESAEVTGVRIVGGDRVIAVGLRWRTRLGDDLRSNLTLEVGGKQTNAILVTEEGVIVDALRPVSGRVNRIRELLPGRPYVAPPTFGRFPADGPWTWPEGESDATLQDFLRENTLAMSGLLAAEIAHRCGIALDTSVADISDEQRHALESACADVVVKPEPWILDGSSYAAFPPHSLPGELLTRCGSFVETAGTAWDGRLAKEKDNQKLHTEILRLQAEQKKLERLKGNLEDDLRQVARVDEFTRMADLLMAHNSQPDPGSDEIEIVDWFDPAHPTLTVRLDRRFTPVQHAERLYGRARKLRDSEPRTRKRLDQTTERLGEIAALLEEYGDPDITPARRRDMERKKHEQPELRTSSGQIVAPRRYRTRNGNWLVLAGRNDEENDFLSLKIAAQSDYWFHAHGCPGSHIVLKLEGRKDQPSKAALEEAAAAAAYWSKSRGSSKVPVHYTQAKYVSKKKGAAPGSVLIRREKLLMVAPDLPPQEDDVEQDV